MSSPAHGDHTGGDFEHRIGRPGAQVQALLRGQQAIRVRNPDQDPQTGNEVIPQPRDQPRQFSGQSIHRRSSSLRPGRAQGQEPRWIRWCATRSLWRNGEHVVRNVVRLARGVGAGRLRGYYRASRWWQHITGTPPALYSVWVCVLTPSTHVRY